MNIYTYVDEIHVVNGHVVQSFNDPRCLITPADLFTFMYLIKYMYPVYILNLMYNPCR